MERREVHCPRGRAHLPPIAQPRKVQASQRRRRTDWYWRERVAHAQHWRAEFEEMQQHFKDLGEVDFRLYKAMQEWHNRIGDMLAHVNDVLTPHEFDDIIKNDFAGLRQMLARRL
jgi:hypothetical protein